LENQEFDTNLKFFTDYLNLTVEINNKIRSCENLGMQTPDHIKSIINDLSISSNLLIIFSDCMVIAKAFNDSNVFLYQTFYVKSIYRIVCETFKLFDKYNKLLFENSDDNDSAKEIIQLQKEFRKQYNLESIRLIRNKIGSHYTENFIEHITHINNLDIKGALDMFYDFLNLINRISTYITMTRFPLDRSHEIFQSYFLDVEKYLIKINKKQ